MTSRVDAYVKRRLQFRGSLDVTRRPSTHFRNFNDDQSTRIPSLKVVLRILHLPRVLIAPSGSRVSVIFLSLALDELVTHTPRDLEVPGSIPRLSNCYTFSIFAGIRSDSMPVRGGHNISITTDNHQFVSRIPTSRGNQRISSPTGYLRSLVIAWPGHSYLI